MFFPLTELTAGLSGRFDSSFQGLKFEPISNILATCCPFQMPRLREGNGTQPSAARTRRGT